MLCVYHLNMCFTLWILMTHINIEKIQENAASLKLCLNNFTSVKCVRFRTREAMQCFCMQTWSCFWGWDREEANGEKLKHVSVTLSKLHLVRLSCAAFSRWFCCCHCCGGFGCVCRISLRVLCFTLPVLSFSLAASVVDTMPPLLNWTFISVGRSKGRDHFVFIVVTINLPSEIFIYPQEIVDSDEYSPDYNGVFNNNYKKKKKIQGSPFPSKCFMIDGWGLLWAGLPSSKSRMSHPIMVCCFYLLLLVDCGEDIFSQLRVF